MTKIININNYSPVHTDKFLFDANIWLYLYCPLGSYNSAAIKNYENFLVKVIKANSTIYISSLILSEFINRYIRLDFNIKKNINPGQFAEFKKDYRPSAEYSNTIKTIRATINQQISQITKQADDNFSGYNLKDILNRIENSDFNDLCSEELSSISSFKIVTDDRDFLHAIKAIEVLTANPKLLNPPKTN